MRNIGNRIGSPVRGTVFGDYRFDNGIKLRVEGEGWSSRNRVINLMNTMARCDALVASGTPLSRTRSCGT